MNCPELTIVVSLWRTIEGWEGAVKRIFEQSFQDFEVLFVGQKDKLSFSKDLLQDSRISSLELPAQNTDHFYSQSLNQVLKKSKGKWITIFEPSGISAPHRLEEQVKFLKEHPHFGALGTSVYHHHLGKLAPTYYPTTHEQLCDTFLNEYRLEVNTLIFAKEALLNAGGFSETPDSEYIEVLDALVRVAKISRIGNLSQCLYTLPEKSHPLLKNQKKIFNRNIRNLVSKVHDPQFYRKFWKIADYSPAHWTHPLEPGSSSLPLRMRYDIANDALRAARTLIQLGERNSAKNRIFAVILRRPDGFLLWILQRVRYVWGPRILNKVFRPIRSIINFFHSVYHHGLRRQIYYFYLTQLQPLLGRTYSTNFNRPSSVPLDIIIPATEKDIEVLPFSIRSMKEFVRHPIGKIFIVSPESDPVRKLCVELGTEFILETTISPLKKSEIGFKIEGQDRSGWLLQQFIKLNSDHLSTQDHFLVLDADTTFVKPVVFSYHSKSILNCSDERHIPYYKMIHRILGQIKIFPLSFVAHHMVFEKAKLQALKKEIEFKAGVPWYQAILKQIDRSQISGFSEYETYGNYCANRYPDEFHFEYWFNLSFPRSFVESNWNVIKRLVKDKRTKTVSFHHYIEE